MPAKEFAIQSVLPSRSAKPEAQALSGIAALATAAIASASL